MACFRLYYPLFWMLIIMVSYTAQANAQLPVVGSANVTLHYEADTLTFNNNDPVTVWPATTGIDAMAELTERAPLFETNWSPSGLPGVTFDDVDDRLLVGTTGGDTGINADAIFAVLKMNGTGGGEQQFVFGAQTGATPAKVMGVRNGALFVYDEPAGTAFSDTSSLHVISWVSGSPLRINGIEPGGDTTRNHVFPNISFIGDERLVPDNPGPNMTFGELITYQATGDPGNVMDPADRTTIEGYLKTKWGVVPPDQSTPVWSEDGIGRWTDTSNWSTSGAPVTADHSAIFSDAISAPTSVIVDTEVTVNSVTFDHTISYVVAGAGSVNLAASSDSTLPAITVAQGSHQLQVVANLQNDTTADVATDSTLTFNNALNLNGNTLTKTSDGKLLINNVLTTGGGTVSGLAGVIGGTGTVGGDLNNSGTVSPGYDPGTLVSGGMSVVPEPSTLLLIALGGLTLSWRRRRR